MLLSPFLRREGGRCAPMCASVLERTNSEIDRYCHVSYKLGSVSTTVTHIMSRSETNRRKYVKRKCLNRKGLLGRHGWLDRCVPLSQQARCMSSH